MPDDHRPVIFGELKEASLAIANRESNSNNCIELKSRTSLEQSRFGFVESLPRLDFP